MKRDLPLLDEHLNQEVTITLRLGDVLRLAEAAPSEPRVEIHASARIPAEYRTRSFPSVVVGSDYEGGKFAGITLDGEQLAALVLLPGDFKGTWAEAKDWAEKEGGVLPSRHDQLVLFNNMKGEFQQAYYWSSEQHVEYAGYAWGQDFGYGYQGCSDVSYSYRARAVRRIPIL